MHRELSRTARAFLADADACSKVRSDLLPCGEATMGEHDHSYKLLFSEPRMVEDLLRGFVPDEWVEELDFSTLWSRAGRRRTSGGWWTACCCG